MNFHNRHRSPAYRLLAVVLFISALAHIPILALLLTLTNTNDDTFDPATFNKTEDDFSIQLVDDEPQNARQYVQLPAPEREEAPDEADFEAQHAQKVERQTVRRAPAAPLPVAAARPSSQTERSAEKPPTPEHILPPQTPEKPVESSENPEPVETTDDIAEPDLGPLRRPTLDVPAPPGEQEPAEPPALFPTLDDPFVAQQAAAGGHDNHIPDIEEGNQTLLNRQRTKYWAFFDRIVNQVRDNWNGTDVYQRHDPDGSIYGVKDRATTLRIALRGDGTIHNIWISSSSGLQHLDQEAIRAMRAAAPFYNPPEALKDKDGLVMFSFTFFIEIRADDSRRMRIRWRP